MPLSENVATVEQKINETWEQGRERVLSLVEDVKERAESTAPDTSLLREQLTEGVEIARTRIREDLDRNQKFVVQSVKNLVDRLPDYQLPFDAASTATSGFDFAQSVMDRNRSFTMEIIEAVTPAPAKKPAAKKAAAKKAAPAA